jgi:hypothetical protein
MYTGKHVHRYTGNRASRPYPVILLSAFCFLLSSCGLTSAPATASATAPFSAPFFIVTRDPSAASQTPFGPVTVTPTLIPTETPVPTLTATLDPNALPTNTPPPVVLLARPYYTIYATVDYDGHTVEVDQSITYPNQTGVSLNEIVLAVEPMLYGNAFYLSAISVNGALVTNYSLVTHRLTVPLSTPLAPGRQLTLVLEYDLNVPVKQKANTFGWLSYQTNLTDWYPFVVPYDASAGWLIYDFMPFGEHLVYDSADFDINLRFVDSLALSGVEGSAPIIAAPALAESNGEWTRYRLNGARTFALSMSREFFVSESAVGSVVTRSYYFAGHEDAGAKMSFVGTQVIGLFEPIFAPYPYPVINVVELDYNDGQEYDGLCFLSSGFYEAYNGTSQNNLVVLGVHEMAHNWWFGLVGNDQAMEPWLDEAMSVYSERIFFEYTNPGIVDWWWQFRVNYFGPSGWVDTDIYNGGAFRDYTDAVYFNGATFLEDLRVRIGDQAFYAFLKDYAGQMSHRRATANDFFTILRQHTKADISDLIAAYFANPH